MDGSTTISNQLLVTIITLLLANMATVATIVIRAMVAKSRNGVLTKEQHALVVRMGIDGITPELRERLHHLAAFVQAVESRITVLEIRTGEYTPRATPRSL